MPYIKTDQIYGTEIITSHLEIFRETTRNLPSPSAIMFSPDLLGLFCIFMYQGRSNLH